MRSRDIFGRLQLRLRLRGSIPAPAPAPAPMIESSHEPKPRSLPGVQASYRVSQNYPNILFWRPKGRAKQFYVSSLCSSMVNLVSNIVAHSVRQILFQSHR